MLLSNRIYKFCLMDQCCYEVSNHIWQTNCYMPVYMWVLESEREKDCLQYSRCRTNHNSEKCDFNLTITYLTVSNCKMPPNLGFVAKDTGKQRLKEAIYVRYCRSLASATFPGRFNQFDISPLCPSLLQMRPIHSLWLGESLLTWVCRLIDRHSILRQQMLNSFALFLIMPQQEAVHYVHYARVSLLPQREQIPLPAGSMLIRYYPSSTWR